LINIKGKKNTSILPRDHTTVVSGSGMITITGGKWTTYRTMGKSAVDNAVFVGKLPKKTCVTESLPLHGFMKDQKNDEHLSVYGSDASEIKKIMNEQPGREELIHPDLPYTKAEITWAVQHEMAMTVEDILTRRTRALILDAKAAITAAPMVAELMSKEMDLSTDWQTQQVKDFRNIAEQYLIH
jgi:glycerol-3-phosphate dehydrogenase